MIKTTKTINKINDLLQSVSGLYLDDDIELEQIYKEVKKYVKKVKKAPKYIMINWNTKGCDE